ncbi:MAG: AAA family ATPase, partial [Muribaculaceae bacterium]|nr:AAA family ATPase [Muribaculaceae bacterium]
MLKNLIIRNYALIEHLDLEFGPGLTIITGETGAGKSIMLGALSLVMGGRADTKVISDGGSKSVVEALFTNVDPELRSLFAEKGIDWIEDAAGVSELTVRRELTASGRSKVFVNDTSVTLQTLSAIVPRLIDIHSQHANAKINDPAERLRIIDSMAGNAEIRQEYESLFNDYVELRRRINARKAEIAKSAENIGFLRFQLEQLDRLDPKSGELKEIERRFEMLSDADEIKERLYALSSLLGDGDRGAQSMLAESVSLADRIDFSLLGESPESAVESVNPIVGRLRQLLVEVKDIYETVDDYNSAIDTDPAALAKLSARMDLYYELVKRFRVREADELVAMREDIRRQVADVAGDDGELPEMEREMRRIGHELKAKADQLTQTRVSCAAEFSRRLCETARPLGLANISFSA